MSFLSWKLFLASFTNDKILSTIYQAEKSYDFVFQHRVDIYRLSSNQRNVACPFLFPFSTTGKKFIPRLIPVSKFWRVVENHSQSDKSRSSASIFVLYPKFDISRHLHVSVSVFLKNLLSLTIKPFGQHLNRGAFGAHAFEIAVLAPLIFHSQGGSCPPCPLDQHATDPGYQSQKIIKRKK